MARIGYIRVSSADQNLDRQVENLSDVFKVFSDKLEWERVKIGQV